MSIKYVIVDIDGTVADLSHRIHFIEGEKKDWDSFYNNVGILLSSLKFTKIGLKSLVSIPPTRLCLRTGRLLFRCGGALVSLVFK